MSPIARPGLRASPPPVAHDSWRSNRPDQAIQLGLWAMVALAALYLAWPLWRAGLVFVTDAPNEGWNALLAADAMAGRTLYPPPGGLVVNNYPPLGFYIFGAWGALFGDTILAGRVLSLMAFLAVAAEVALIVRALGGRWPEAIFAAVLFVATLAKSANEHVAMLDGQLLAHAIMTGALLIMVGRRRPGAVAGAAVLVVLALGIKHNLIAVPLAVTLWLWRTDRRALAVWVVVGAAAAVALAAAFFSLYGEDMVSNLLAPRVYSLWRTVALLPRLQTVVVALAVWGVFAWGGSRGIGGRDAATALITLLIGFGLLSCIVQRSGEGVMNNAMFELIIAAAIAVGHALPRLSQTRLAHRFGAGRVAAVAVAALCLRVALIPYPEMVRLATDPDFRHELVQHQAATAADIAFLRTVPGPVLCEALALCYWAGKGLEYVAFNVDQAIQTGALDPSAPAARLARGDLAAVQLGTGSPLLGQLPPGFREVRRSINGVFLAAPGVMIGGARQ